MFYNRYYKLIRHVGNAKIRETCSVDICRRSFSFRDLRRYSYLCTKGVRENIMKKRFWPYGHYTLPKACGAYNVLTNYQ